MSGDEGAPPQPDAAGQAPKRPFLVAAVGASAGGLEAFTKLLQALPPEPGIALLFASHMPSDSPTMLPEILSRKSALPVEEATEGARVEMNRGYVIPPGQYLELVDGVVHLEPLEPGHPKLTIDRLFRSFAEVLGERAVGVVLSGTGGDGTLGLQAIKAAGGVTFASDDASAAYPGMPRSAIASGAVDHVLPIAEIAARLTQVARLGDGRTPAPRVDEEALGPILQSLHAATGHDFSGYEKGTLRRRIERRQRALGLLDTAEYAARLGRDDHEPHRLFRDLLVGVSSFFRDPEVFEALEREVLPARLAARQHADAPLRAWVPACSTGEEAYSIAMTLLDAPGGPRASERTIQVFASDIDDAALEVARRGLYPASIAADVPPDKLRRYFVRDGDNYRVGEMLRDKLIFSMHSLVRDPPFSRLDLLSCRNLLIYLEPALQRRVFPIFHCALHEGGLLVLGGSESTGVVGDLFEPLDQPHKIFRRKAGHAHALELSSRGPGALPRPRGRDTDEAPETRNVSERVERAVRERHMPPLLVVRSDGEIVHVRGRTSGFLELPEGAPSTNVLQMSSPAGRAELRAALLQARRSRETVALGALESPSLPADRRLHVTVEPLDPEQDDDLLLVLFEVRESKSEPSAAPGGPSERAIRELEDEVRTLREALQTTVEDLESTNEELTASNEELLSMNEELQSANEELETSKEEVQSVNEELSSVNAELNDKVQELTRINDDITNLLASTQVATLFLDPDLRVARFTPAVTEIYKLLDAELMGEIVDGTRERFELERRLKTHEGRTIIVNEAVSSIPAGDDSPRLLIATIQDVTAARRAAEALRAHSALAQLGEMAAIMAHEVRNALAGIRGAVDVIGRRLPEGSEERGAVGEVRTRIAGIESMVQALMQFSRPRVPRFQQVQLRSLLEEVADGARAASPEVKVEVSGDEVALMGDPQLLRAAFLNLCLNAVQATEDTERDGAVEVRIEPGGSEVAVSVVDRGRGIPDETRARLFEPFFTTRSRGTGLGMPIAKRITEAHGGQIRVESVEGEGSTITVRLPLRHDG